MISEKKTIESNDLLFGVLCEHAWVAKMGEYYRTDALHVLQTRKQQQVAKGLHAWSEMLTNNLVMFDQMISEDQLSCSISLEVEQ